MGSTEYYAHISEDGRYETIDEHLCETAKLAAEFALDFESSSIAYLTAKAHDIGKFSLAFQRRLKGAPERVDHSTAGAWECAKINNLAAAYVVAAHHTGLPDGGSKGDNDVGRSFYSRMNRARHKKIEAYDAWLGKLPEAPVPLFFEQETNFGKSFYIRMLYSALVDADYLATEAFMQNKKREQLLCDMNELNCRLESYVKGWFPPKGMLNEQRCSILNRCRQAGENEEPGLFTLTVPTGGGKTVASLAFALEQAKKNNMKRIIYVIPYTSIIEQTAETMRNILGEDVVLEHHSGVAADIKNECTCESIRLTQATENWDMPIIVTTAVQFFESLYANRSSKCRKLHNIANSVVIFDEAQMMPLPYLKPCVAAIAQLVDHYRVSAVLCTATQPALQTVFQDIGSNLCAKELCPDQIYDATAFRRVRYEVAGKLSTDELAEKINSQKQSLCIVNSRAAASDLYKKISDEGRYHLSTLMFPAHRQLVLKEIRKRLKENLPCKVISTSLIEAGVDVDFPKVYREMAGLDSILQAAGRCNREGKRSVQESVVTIFRGEWNMPPLFSPAIAAAQTTLERYHDFAGSEATAYYFKELLELKGQSAQDKNKILSLIENSLLPFETVAERFHLIDSPTKTIYIPCAENHEQISQLMEGYRSRNLMRFLNRYGVSVYERHFDELAADGWLVLLEGENAVLNNPELYSKATGLSLKQDTGSALFI